MDEALLLWMRWDWIFLGGKEQVKVLITKCILPCAPIYLSSKSREGRVVRNQLIAPKTFLLFLFVKILRTPSPFFDHLSFFLIRIFLTPPFLGEKWSKNYQLFI